jgi:hypothetical protein
MRTAPTPLAGVLSLIEAVGGAFNPNSHCMSMEIFGHNRSKILVFPISSGDLLPYFTLLFIKRGIIV